MVASALVMETLVEARGLVKEYGAGVRVVDDVSFEIGRGETLGLVGESGSGKSTVARMLLRLIEPTAGEVRYGGENLMDLSGRELRALRRKMQIVFQDPFAALNPRMRVRGILAEPFAIHRTKGQGLSDLGKAGVEQRLTEMLKEVGLDASALERYPHEFSGGQRQRINIARALALRPEFVVLDEPVSALDVSVGAQVVNLLRELQRKHGLTYLFISHSMPLVRYLCDRVAVMRKGRLVELGACEQVCAEPKEAYTRELIAATPEMSAYWKCRFPMDWEMVMGRETAYPSTSSTIDGLRSG
jgi:ABC-type microcin C transport system duplicated ATPase subunit YejF